MNKSFALNNNHNKEELHTHFHEHEHEGSHEHCHSDEKEHCDCKEHHHSESHQKEHHHHTIVEHNERCKVCGNTMDNCICSAANGIAKKVYILENLDCANCAAKIEQKIKELPQVVDATITYATKQLRVTANNQEQLIPAFQEICSSIESAVKVIPRQSSSVSHSPVSDEKTKKKKLSETMISAIEIGLGAILFIAGEIIEKNGIPTASMITFIIAYILLGGKIIITALKNITKGQIFDENFLMSVATLAAFTIQDYAEAVGVMLFYRIGELFEHVAVEKSRSQIMETVDIRPEEVTLVSGNNRESATIPAADAKIGDILLVRPGDRVPLDGIVVEGESRIDTSAITGESVPIKVQKDSEVLSGCVNTSGLLKIKVTKVLEESMVSRILDSVENAAASKPKIDRFITKFARIYTPFVVILALATAIIPSLITGNWNYWIYTAITFLVISCPCALVLSVPLAFFSGIGAGSQRGILFKGGIALEAMKEVKAVIMDKTGTITMGNFTVQDIFPVEGITKEELLSLAASCELRSTHPIGTSIVAEAKKQELSITHPNTIKELSGKGIQAFLSKKGEILCGNKELLESFSLDLSNYNSKQYGTEVLVALNGVYIGYLIISDTIKSEAKSAVSLLKKQKIFTAMLTGDSYFSANNVAKETGIEEVHAKLLPQDKLRELEAIRKQHGSVMFVGDGINDAPVLAGANVGAAMGSGSDAAIEAADVVFMTSSVTAIPESISIAKITSNIAKQNVVFALAIKALVMVLGLTGFANMWVAVFADTGVAMLCVLNSIRILYSHKAK